MNNSSVLEGAAAVPVPWARACCKHIPRKAFSSVSFVLFVSCLFLWYVTRLCYSVGSSRQLQWLECYIHMWSVAPEITTCTSDGSVDSVTRGVH